MDTELHNGIRAFIDKRKGLIELNNEESAKATDIVAAKYIKNRNSSWWWEELSEKSVIIEYGESDGLSLLRQIIGSDNIIAMLFVTDDEPDPWPIFMGELWAIIEIISEQRIFEYFITINDFSCLIFDTHHNSLIVVGELVEAARKFQKKFLENKS